MSIGLAGQYAAVDELLTGRENLEFIGLWCHLGRQAYRRRAADAPERFGLTEAGNRPVKTYSGGMHRRLDLAASLIAEPPVVFLDEPTTGLTRGRNDLWAFVEERVASGTTALLTTRYIEEAERLAHRIVVIDTGRVVAEGTSAELEDRLGGATIEHAARGGPTLAGPCRCWPRSARVLPTPTRTSSSSGLRHRRERLRCSRPGGCSRNSRSRSMISASAGLRSMTSSSPSPGPTPLSPRTTRPPHRRRRRDERPRPRPPGGHRPPSAGSARNA